MKTIAAVLAIAGVVTAAPWPEIRMVPRQFSNSSSSAAASASPTSSAPPASTTTWKADVLVGQTSFQIGDADTSQFENLWKNVCHDSGCDTGSPPTFDFQVTSNGEIGASDGTGTFEMSAEVNTDMDLMNWLLDSLNAAVLKTVSCNDVHYSECQPPGWIGPPTCTSESMTVCTMVNFAQITIYDQDSNEVAQIKMGGSSQLDQGGFDCGGAKDIINDALAPFELNPIADGVLAAFNIICDVAGA